MTLFFFVRKVMTKFGLNFLLGCFNNIVKKIMYLSYENPLKVSI